MGARKYHTPEEKRLARNACAAAYRAAHPELKIVYAERRKEVERIRREADPEGYRQQHIEAVRAYRATHTELVKERCRLAVRRINAKKYGCPPELIEAWDHASKFGNCEICGKPAKDSAKGRLHKDHAHTDPPVDPPVPRGCLCDCCNHGLGKFQDSPELLAAAIRYLRTKDPRYRA